MFFVAFPFPKNKNNTQNINTSYVSSVWIYTSCLQAFLMCFGLALGVKSCKHRSVLRFFSDCILTVFWLYFDCIYTKNMILLYARGLPLHWVSITYIPHVLVVSRVHKNTPHVNATYIFLRFLHESKIGIHVNGVDV